MSRTTKKDRIRFLDIAIGSAFELKSQMIITFELKYIQKSDTDVINNLITKTLRLTNGYKNYLK